VFINSATGGIQDLADVVCELSRGVNVDFKYCRPIPMNLKYLGTCAAGIGTDQRDKICVSQRLRSSCFALQFRNGNKALVGDNQKQRRDRQCGYERPEQ